MILKNPSFSLYALQLQNSLGKQREDDALALLPRFKGLCAEFGIADWPPASLRDIGLKQNPLRAEQNLLDRPISAQQDGVKLDIMAYLLHDVLLLDVTLYSAALEFSQLSQLHPNACLMAQNIQASLGQTLLFYAQPDAPAEQWPELADRCLTALGGPDPNACRRHQGTLCGGQLFEYQDAQAQHWLIWLGQDETLPCLQAIYRDWQNYLVMRHKILFIQSESEWDNNEARRLYAELEQQLEHLKLELKQEEIFKKQEVILHQMPPRLLQFNKHLRNLSDHLHSLTTNQQNYTDALKTLEAQGSLDFARAFGAMAQWHIQQIQLYQEYLKPAPQLFEYALRSIHGSVEIKTLKQMYDMEEAEYRRQEDLEVVVAFIASLLEASAISVKVDHHHELPIWFAQQLDKIGLHIGHNHVFEISTYLVLVGLPAALLTVGLLKVWQYFRDKRSKVEP